MIYYINIIRFHSILNDLLLKITKTLVPRAFSIEKIYKYQEKHKKHLTNENKKNILTNVNSKGAVDI